MKKTYNACGDSSSLPVHGKTFKNVSVNFSVKGLPTLKQLAAVLNMEGNTNSSITALSPPSLIFHREK
jgi:hypothetical protein